MCDVRKLNYDIRNRMYWEMMYVSPKLTRMLQPGQRQQWKHVSLQNFYKITIVYCLWKWTLWYGRKSNCLFFTWNLETAKYVKPNKRYWDPRSTGNTQEKLDYLFFKRKTTRQIVVSRWLGVRKKSCGVFHHQGILNKFLNVNIYQLSCR